MRSMKYIDKPFPLPEHLYREAVEGIVHRNYRIPGLKAIYQFGNITRPGISDLDLVFVFEEGAKCNLKGTEELPERHKPLFTHGIMACAEKHFIENNHFTLWSDYQLKWGASVLETNHVKTRTQEQEKALKVQTALEFLLANYIDLKVQRAYGIVKLRALLQHLKGILYDLEYLDDQHAPIQSSLLQLKSWIQHWFDQTPDEAMLTAWLHGFEAEYTLYTEQKLKEIPLYLPAAPHYPIAKNMELSKGDYLSFTQKGWTMPNHLYFLGRKYFKLQNKLNRFSICCPLQHSADEMVVARFAFLQRMKAYNKVHLPHFMTMTTSITAKLI